MIHRALNQYIQRQGSCTPIFFSNIYERRLKSCFLPAEDCSAKHMDPHFQFQACIQSPSPPGWDL